MTRIDYALIAAALALCYVMATALHDESTIRSGIGLQNGVIEVYEAGRK